jgi:tricarballylate dehydrogenase
MLANKCRSGGMELGGRTAVARTEACDIIVIGAGSAAFEAAVAAKHAGAARVVMLEKAPEAEFGGNARYSGTGFRFVHGGAAEIRQFVPDLDDALFATMIIPPYTAADFTGDLDRMTRGRMNRELAQILVTESNAAVHWMREVGIKWEPLKEHAKVDGKRYFERGIAIHVAGGGVGQLTQWRRIAEEVGIEIRFDSPVCALHGDLRRVEGVGVSGPAGRYDLMAKAVIACAGGFQANPEMRARYLAGNTDLMKVRGSRHDTGEVLRLLLELGARAAGQWQSGHMSPIDAKAPDFETPQHADGRGNTQSRYDYPFGISVNALGMRFFDEGEAQHSYTYAKTGRAVLAQPGAAAYQIYDQSGIKCFRYPNHEMTFVEADTIAALAGKIGVEPKVLVHTVDEFNRAVCDDRPFDPRRPDGRATRGLGIPKSNWAVRIEQPPFRALPVTGGITFTFGGVDVSRNAQVINTIDQPIKGLFASGDIVGLFFHNYPSFTGQTRNAVFGRLAGRAAVEEN